MKSILITGASSGIGRAAAEAFLADGWRVGLVARRADLLEEIAATHENAVALPADVTKAAALEAVFDAFGPLDVLFNNAGMFGPSGPIDEIAVADWEQVLMVNLHGMFLAARLAFAAMRAQGRGGRIINNGSISAHTPREGSVCYTTTKHAITGLTKSLSLDGRPYDIACGQIDIGNAETDMVARLKEQSPQTHTMGVENASRAVVQMASLPLEANVQFMTIMATKMPYVGRG
ncbi:MAG: SDR family oxidoreductase [Sulfitobacter sp.]